MDAKTAQRLAALLETLAGKLDSIGGLQQADIAESRLAACQIAAADDCAVLGVPFFQREPDDQQLNDEARRGLWRAYLEHEKNQAPDQAPFKPSGGNVDRRKATFTLTSPNELSLSKSRSKSKSKASKSTATLRATPGGFSIGVPDVTLMKATPHHDPIAEAAYQATACRWLAKRLLVAGSTAANADNRNKLEKIPTTADDSLRELLVFQFNGKYSTLSEAEKKRLNHKFWELHEERLTKLGVKFQTLTRNARREWQKQADTETRT